MARKTNNQPCRGHQRGSVCLAQQNCTQRKCPCLLAGLRRTLRDCLYAARRPAPVAVRHRHAGVVFEGQLLAGHWRENGFSNFLSSTAETATATAAPVERTGTAPTTFSSHRLPHTGNPGEAPAWTAASVGGAGQAGLRPKKGLRGGQVDKRQKRPLAQRYVAAWPPGRPPCGCRHIPKRLRGVQARSVGRRHRGQTLLPWPRSTRPSWPSWRRR